MLDEALEENLIAEDPPYIKAQGAALLDERYASEEEGLDTIDSSIRTFYETEYPELYSSRQAAVEQAIAQLGNIYERTHFPHMNAYWDSYPNNEGHKEFPGCWRCHDGNHLNADNEIIPASCDTCHAIPEVVGPDQELPTVDLSAPERPESHESSLWIAEHRFRFDATCDDCHTVNNPGGSDNTSFCSNSGCHVGTEAGEDTDGGWTFLDIDAPEILALVLPEPQPSARRLPRIPHPINANSQCSICHGLEKSLAYPQDHADYTPAECTDCHRLEAAVASDMQTDLSGVRLTEQPEAISTPTGLRPPTITHTLAENENCLACHAVNSTIDPAPFTHSSFTNETCQMCHELADEFADVAPMSDVTEEDAPAPTAAPEETKAPPETPDETPIETPEPTPTATEVDVDAADEATPVATETPAADAELLITSHPIAGNENCLACHAVDSAIDPAPPDHAAYTNDTCERCHIPAPEGAPADAAPPAPEADVREGLTDTITADTITTDTVTADAVTTFALAAPPAIPHPLAAWSDCQSCHADETASARYRPHAGRSPHVPE